MIMNKVNEPNNHNTKFCDRCDNEYCDFCVNFETVDFEVKEERNWYGVDVCPWCYNQLLDLIKKVNIKNKKQRNEKWKNGKRL